MTSRRACSLRLLAVPITLVVILSATIARPRAAGAVHSEAIILKAKDAPADVTRARITRSRDGAPASIAVTIKNNWSKPVIVYQVVAMVFDGQGALRMQAYNGSLNLTTAECNAVEERVLSHACEGSIPIPSSGYATTTINVRNVESRADWHVVVAVESANGGILRDGSRTWRARDLLVQAKARLPLNGDF